MRLIYSESKLSNGIRVITSHIPHVDSVAVGFWIGVGGRYETTRMSGVSHFIEHLLFKGTKNRNARDISEAIEGRGGYFNAFTQEDATCYYARISSEHLKRILDILADMYLNPLFSEKDIDKERRVIIEEIMMYRDQPHQVVQEKLGELIWNNHALGRPLIGTPENILRMSRDEIMTYKEQKYTPANTVIALSGNVNHEQSVEYLEKLLGGISRRRKPVSRRVNDATGQDRIWLGKKNIEQAHLALGIRIFGRHDARRYPLKLLSVILGENMSSRLFQIVREKHGMAYSVHSGMHLYDDTGALLITAGLDRERLLPASRLIVKELRKIKDRPVSKKELQRAKDYAAGQLKIGLEGTSSQMIWVGEHLMCFGYVRQPQEIIDRLNTVTISDISNIANDVLKYASASISVLMPDGNAIESSMVCDIFNGIN